MGETREGNYNFEMNGKIMKATHDMQKAIETRHFYVSLLDDPKGFPSYFLGIDGQLKRNDCAYRLALAVHSGLVTYKEAIEKLRKFSNDIIEMAEEYADYAKEEIGYCPCCGTAIGIKGEWEQLSLWSQSELDQI